MIAPGSSPTTPRPRLPPVGAALSLLAEAAGNRFTLAGLELEEAREHALRSLLLGVTAGLFALLGGMALTLLLAALVWNAPHREWWLAALTVFDLGVAGVALTVLRRRLRQWRPLAETQNQLQRDQQCLTTLLQETFR